MRKSIKIPLYIFLAFVLTFLTAIAIVPLIFDPNDYKLEITQAVKKYTGRRLEIEGDLKLQVLPKLAVITEKITMYNPDGYGRKTFAEFDNGFFRVKLVPLFSKRIEIKKIVLNGLRVHLIRTKDGRANWKRFRGSSSSSTFSGKHRIPIEYENAPPQRKVTVDSPLAVLLDTKIDIFGSEVDYEDRSSGIQLEVTNLDFILDRFAYDRGIDFKIKGDLTNSRPVFRENADISGRLYINEKLNQFKIEEFRWKSGIEGGFIPEELKQAELTASAEIDLAADTLSVRNLKLTSGQTSIGANLSASRIFANPSLEGQVTLQNVNPLKLIELASIDYNPKDPSALRRLNGEFALALNESRLMVKDISLVLDGQPIKGVASVTGFEAPKMKFNVSMEHLDADRYLPESGSLPRPARPAKPEPPPGISVVGETPPEGSNGNTSNNADPKSSLQGILNLGSLRYQRLFAEGVQMAFHISNGVIRSNQRFKKFYGGRLKGSVEFNNREYQPVISLNQKLTDVQIGPLLEDFQGKKPIEGTMRSTIRLIGHGANLNTFQSTLNGDIDATLTNGEIHGIDLDKAVREAKKLADKSGIDSDSVAGITKFSNLTYRANISDGIINNTLIEANSTSFDISGNGKINLVNDAVDYKINAVINKNPQGIAGIKIKELQGLKIPIQLSGTLSALTVRPEVKEALKDPKIKNAAQKLEKKLDKKLGAGTTRRLLDNLF